MTTHLDHPRDIALLNLVGITLYRMISKARSYVHRPDASNRYRKGSTQEWNEETAIGYEAGWAGIRQAK